MMDFTEKTLSSEELYHGRVLHLFRDRITLPNGRTTTREYCKHPGAVCVVPLTEDNEVVMVRQYRYPFAGEILEVPAGKLDPGEEWLHSAKRELSEETGAEAADWVYLGDFYSSVAILDESIHMYLARGLTFRQMHTDEDEFLRLERIPLDTLIDMIMQGQVPDGKSQAVLLKAKKYLEQNP